MKAEYRNFILPPSSFILSRWATPEARKTPFQRVARLSGHRLEPFERLTNRIGRQRAIARKLQGVIWPVLSVKVANRRTEPEQVANCGSR